MSTLADDRAGPPALAQTAPRSASGAGAVTASARSLVNVAIPHWRGGYVPTKAARIAPGLNLSMTGTGSRRTTNVILQVDGGPRANQLVFPPIMAAAPLRQALPSRDGACVFMPLRPTGGRSRRL